MSEFLPDGVTLADLEALDLDVDRIAPQFLEKAAILADLAIKDRATKRREGWIQQAKIAAFVKKHELWRYHPGNFGSITEWARQTEIDIESGLLSEMIAIVEFAPTFADAGIDIYQLILDVGGSKVRKLVPTMREAARAEILVEQVGPMLEELRGTDLNGIIDMINPKGARVGFDPEVVYEERDDGSFTISFPSLDLDQLEFLTKKLRLRRWVDPAGRQIEPPMLPASI
jgi:hypothetical protein